MKLVAYSLTALALVAGTASASEFTSVSRAVPASEVYLTRDVAQMPAIVQITDGTARAVTATKVYGAADLSEMGLSATDRVAVTGFPTFNYANNPASQR